MRKALAVMLACNKSDKHGVNTKEIQSTTQESKALKLEPLLLK